MPHVSKYELDEKTKKTLHEDLIGLIVDCPSKFGTRKILFEILTKTEKIMLAKRLAIVFLVEEGCTSYEIGQRLKVSTSTVDRMISRKEAGFYKTILEECKNKKKKEGVLGFLESLLFVLPPRVGKERYPHKK